MTICYENKEFKFSERQLIDLFLRNYPSYTFNLTTDFVENTADVDNQHFRISAKDDKGHMAKVRFFIWFVDNEYYLQMVDCFYGDYVDDIYLGR